MRNVVLMCTFPVTWGVTHLFLFGFFTSSLETNLVIVSAYFWLNYSSFLKILLPDVRERGTEGGGESEP